MKQEEAQQHNERLVAPPEEQQPQPGAPLAQSLSCGVSTFLAAGVVDLVGHLGLTGLVVGGIAAYAASQHGPQLLEQVKGAFPTRPSSPQGEAPRTLASESGGRRSLLDRALGRFPAPEEASLEDVETILVDEPEETPVASLRQMQRPVTPIAHPIHLAPDLVLEANDIVGAGINIFGVKGSGKTGAVARLAEQFARFRVSEVFFDIKGDLVSLVTDRRPDGRPYAPNGLVGVRGRAPRGRSILHCGLQTVYDLRTWQTPEQMASLICTIVEEMLETVALTPEGELAPCLIFLDEAEYWLPQSQPSYLSGHTYKRLLDAFHLLATMGRSRGLAPVIATQRIAKVNKDIIAQAEMNILMKAVLDIDLDRYSDYFNKALATRERIRGFQAGEAVVCLPDGSQSVTRFYERESRHRSHTPHITAALTKFAGMRERGPLQVELDNDDGAAAGYVPSADQSIRRVTTPPQAGLPQAEPQRLVNDIPSMPVVRPVKARLSPELFHALAAYQEGATTARALADVLKAQGIQCEKDKAASLIKRLRELGEIP
jgi:hypothetical protein